MEGIELGFRYAAVTIRVEILEGRGATSATGTARSSHAFRSGAKVTTGRRPLAEATLATTGRAITFTVAIEFTARRGALAEVVATLRAALHAMTFGAAVKIATGRRTLAEATVATFAASGRTITFGAAVKIATGRGALAEAAFATFGPALHAVAFRAAVKLATGRRALAETTVATFAASGRTITFGVAVKIATGRGALAETTVATFTATGGAVTFTVAVELAAGRGALAEAVATLRTAVELAAGRGPLAITAITTFGAAIFWTGKFRVAIAAAGTFSVPPHFRARARRPFRSGAFLRTDHAAQTNQAQRAETASKEHRRPDTALIKNSFAAHLDILLTVRRAVSGVLGFDSGGPASIGRVIRPSSCPTVAPEHNGSRHVQITSS